MAVNAMSEMAAIRCQLWRPERLQNPASTGASTIRLAPAQKRLDTPA